MPTYQYKCLHEECGEYFQITRSILAEKKVSCPHCNQDCENVIITGGAAVIDKTPRTLGVLAEQNRKKFGEAYCQQKQREHRERNILAKKTFRELPNPEVSKRIEQTVDPYIPPWRKEAKIDPSLNKLTEYQAKKYVLTGEKPIGL